LSEDEDEAGEALDSFVTYARQMGAEPMIELPIHRKNPEEVAEWVRHCNVEKGEKILYWTIGDEPDLYAEKGKGSEMADYNVYDYINDYRAIYNAVKKVDPSVLIMGPELAWRYTSGEDDWFTPFIQFDGDIVNLASVHHYGSIKAGQCTVGNVMGDVRHMGTLTRNLNERIAINNDFYLPLVITGGNICLESTDNTITAKLNVTGSSIGSSATPLVTSAGGISIGASPAVTAAASVTIASRVKVRPTPTPVETPGSRNFWAALWQAEQIGVLLNDNMPMAFSSYLAGNGALDFFDNKGARSDYWVLRLLSTSMHGKALWVQVHNGNISAYAVQDPKTKDVSLLLINRGNTYYHPKIDLNAKDDNVSVDAGLSMSFDFELPFYSIGLLKIKADRSPGTAYLYTQRMAVAGKPPVMSVLKPW
jgi:hypothetical protein